MGGGSILLWLLLKAGQAPRCARKVVVAGPLVLPTPESCAEWVGQCGIDVPIPDAHSWRRQGLLLGAGGDGRLQRENSWLAPIAVSLAAGRFAALEEDMMGYVDRWARAGHLTFCSPASADIEEGLSLCCSPADGNAIVQNRVDPGHRSSDEACVLRLLETGRPRNDQEVQQGFYTWC